MDSKKLYRSKKEKVLFGICGGLGEYFNVDATIFRILFILLALSGGVGFIFYLVLIFVIPEEGNKTAPIEGIAEDIREKAAHKERKPKSAVSFLGVLIALVGLFLLVKNAAPHYLVWINWSIFWPILIILVGLFLISRK